MPKIGEQNCRVASRKACRNSVTQPFSDLIDVMHRHADRNEELPSPSTPEDQQISKRHDSSNCALPRSRNSLHTNINITTNSRKGGSSRCRSGSGSGCGSGSSLGRRDDDLYRHPYHGQQFKYKKRLAVS